MSFSTSSSVEHLWIKVKLTGTDQLVAGCIYRSPSSDTGQSVEELSVLFNSVVMSEPSHLLICGDFNMPQIDWVHKYSMASVSHPSHKFLSIVQECLLFQYREGDPPSVLDLMLTNEQGMITELSYLPGLGMGKSDHLLLEFCMMCYTCQLTSHQERFNYYMLTSHK